MNQWPEQGYRFTINRGKNASWVNGTYTVVSEIMLTVGVKEPWKFVWVQRDSDGKEMPASLGGWKP